MYFRTANCCCPSQGSHPFWHFLAVPRLLPYPSLLLLQLGKTCCVSLYSRWLCRSLSLSVNKHAHVQCVCAGAAAECTPAIYIQYIYINIYVYMYKQLYYIAGFTHCTQLSAEHRFNSLSARGHWTPEKATHNPLPIPHPPYLCHLIYPDQSCLTCRLPLSLSLSVWSVQQIGCFVGGRRRSFVYWFNCHIILKLKHIFSYVYFVPFFGKYFKAKMFFY